MNTQENNRLIAEFKAGLLNYYHIEYNSGTWYEEHELSYEVSLDWLMPVVEKIESDERFDVNVLQYGTIISSNTKKR